MKFATIALFLGTISAQEFDQELINELKIEVSKAGQQAIAKEAKDVGMTMKKIEHSRPVRNLEASLKRWAHTAEVHNLQKLDKAFLSSPAGKRLVQEWKDVGAVLKKHLKHNKKTGTLYMDNDRVDDLSDELDDVADQYEHLKGSKWDKAYNAAWKKALSTKAAKATFRRMHAFRGSKEGKMLHKEMVDLKRAVKKNLKVTDLPDSDDEDIEEDMEDIASTLTIKVTEDGQDAIEKDAIKIKASMKKVKATEVYKKFEVSMKKWLQTKEVQHIAAVERAFYASKDGQSLLADWKDFGIALKKGIKKQKDGSLKVDNEALNGEIQDEFDDVVDHWDELKHNKWGKMYTTAWKRAVQTKQFNETMQADKMVSQSAEGKLLMKDIQRLTKDIKKGVKFSDLPKKSFNVDLSDSSDASDDEEDFVAKKVVAKKAKTTKKVVAKKDESDSSDDEEDFVAKKAEPKKAAEKKEESDSSDDEEDLIKINVNKAGRKEIKKEWNDVEHVWDRIEGSQPVRNLHASVKRWAHSKEMKDLEALDKKFLSTPRGKKMQAEFSDVFHQLDKSVYHNKAGIQINNKELVHVDDELNDVKDEIKSFKKSKWNKMYDNKMKAVFSNKQAKSVHRRAVHFKKSPQGKALKKEMKEFKMALKKNVKVTDIPKSLAEEDNLYLF